MIKRVSGEKKQREKFLLKVDECQSIMGGYEKDLLRKVCAAPTASEDVYWGCRINPPWD